MVKRIPYYEDANGKPHKLELDAWKSDLIIWLTSTEKVNEASAKALVDHIASKRQNANELGQMIGSLTALIPTEVKPAAVYGADDV